MYRILFDYGCYEGMKLEDEEFATVDAAVKAASGLRYAPFLIVRVIDWQALDAGAMASLDPMEAI